MNSCFVLIESGYRLEGLCFRTFNSNSRLIPRCEELNARSDRTTLSYLKARAYTMCRRHDNVLFTFVQALIIESRKDPSASLLADCFRFTVGFGGRLNVRFVASFEACTFLDYPSSGKYY